MAINPLLMSGLGPTFGQPRMNPRVFDAGLMGVPNAAPMSQPTIGPVRQPVNPGGTRPVPYPHGMNRRRKPRPVQQTVVPQGQPQGSYGQDALLQAMMGGIRRSA